MGRIEKTVFISYRRTNVPWALAIYQNLTMHGYDVFFDFQSIDSGNFEKVILENIKARAHFLVILTPSALEHCKEPGDWLCREIETAMDEKRNIVPLMLESFDFGSPLVTEALTGKLATLKSYNGLRVYSEYFFEAMDKLRERYLNVAVSDIALPAITNVETKAVTKSLKLAASEAPQVEKEELTAQEWFEKGYLSKDIDEEIRCYTEAISLKPDYVEAYNNRGIMRRRKGDLDGAIADYSQVIFLKAADERGYNNRGNARRAKGDLDGAINDYNEAIRIKPDYTNAFSNRGVARQAKGDLDGAINDYDEAIRLNPDYADAYINRGVARQTKGNLNGAIQDYEKTIQINPNDANAYNNCGTARKDKGDLDGAIKNYNDAICLKSDFINAFYNRAMAWQQKKKYSNAIADYQQYLDLGGGIQMGNTKEVNKIIRDLKKKSK